MVSQIEGGTIMALGGALFESVTFTHGHLARPSLSGYRVPRFTDVPELDVVLLDRPDLPSAGAGETPLIAVAPAVANAVIDALSEYGILHLEMPMTPSRIWRAIEDAKREAGQA